MYVQNLPEILTVPDIAKRLKTSRQMVYKLVAEGRLQCYRIGTAIRVSRDREYLRWLDDYVKANLDVLTAKSYEMVVRKHIIPVIGKIPLKRLPPAQVQS